MKDEIILRINREGEFTVNASQRTDNQCGKKGELHYKYFCSIEASSKSLTAEGYVMENLWTHEYFIGRYVELGLSVPSCEQMAQDAIEYFLTLFRTVDELKAVDVRRIYIRIHGSPVSFIEGEWIKK